MSLFDFIRRPGARNSATAATAKERLQILLAHERADASTPDFLPALQREILDVVRRHMNLPEARDAVEVRLERGVDVTSIEINIELPGPEARKAAADAKAEAKKAG